MVVRGFDHWVAMPNGLQSSGVDKRVRDIGTASGPLHGVPRYV